MRGRRRAALVALAVMSLLAVFFFWPKRGPKPPVDTAIVAWDALPGLSEDDLVAALAAFGRSCTRDIAPLLARACANRPRDADAASAAAFFRGFFEPRRVTSGAFFTGYFEPVVAASLVATSAFPIPLRGAPEGLTTVKPGATPGLDPSLTAALRRPDGSLAPLPDRAGIERGELAGAVPIAFVATRADAFFIQVQGSARLRLSDGRLRRLVYAGRNGYPYTAIGKVLANRLHVPPAQVNMSFLRSWISSHGEGGADEGTDLMRANRSYIFFRFDDGAPEELGPPGGEQVRLTAGRSLAIDRAVWPYGLAFFVDARLPDGAPFRHLLIGQDTGAAIKGAGRGDIFFGTGDAAGAKAGAMRSSGTLTVLWPRAAP